jgi:hypothetical protein
MAGKRSFGADELKIVAVSKSFALPSTSRARKSAVAGYTAMTEADFASDT